MVYRPVPSTDSKCFTQGSKVCHRSSFDVSVDIQLRCNYCTKTNLRAVLCLMSYSCSFIQLSELESRRCPVCKTTARWIESQTSGCLTMFRCTHISTILYLARVDAPAQCTAELVVLETKLTIAVTHRWAPARLVTLFLRLEVVCVACTSAVEKPLTPARLGVEKPAETKSGTPASVLWQLAQSRKSWVLF